MFVCKVFVHFILYILILKHAPLVQSSQDQTSPRANTLLDDADDIQKQLENEAKDRTKYGKPKTIWVFHFPTQFPDINGVESFTTPLSKLREVIKGKVKRNIYSTYLGTQAPPSKCDDWNYKAQNLWSKTYPDCGGRSQSPVDLPYRSLIKAKGARNLLFRNYDELPVSQIIQNDGKTVRLKGQWQKKRQPLIYGGAAHSRRYIFHSITLHCPSEHSVGGMLYPMESQILHISAEYKTFEEALNASSRDPLAFLGVANLYKFGNRTQSGLQHMLDAAKCGNAACQIIVTMPLNYYNPPFKEYACYQGSLTVPPCKESVLWLIRAKALLVTRQAVEKAQTLMNAPRHGPVSTRSTQPLNDRKVYYFRN